MIAPPNVLAARAGWGNTTEGDGAKAAAGPLDQSQAGKPGGKALTLFNNNNNKINFLCGGRHVLGSLARKY